MANEVSDSVHPSAHPGCAHPGGHESIRAPHGRRTEGPNKAIRLIADPCECLDALHHSLSKTELEIRNAASFGFNHARHKMAKVAIATMAKMINQAKPT